MWPGASLQQIGEAGQALESDMWFVGHLGFFWKKWKNRKNFSDNFLRASEYTQKIKFELYNYITKF